jgi:hypothetical protein
MYIRFLGEFQPASLPSRVRHLGLRTPGRFACEASRIAREQHGGDVVALPRARTLNLPQNGRQVLGSDLNCFESKP